MEKMAAVLHKLIVTKHIGVIVDQEEAKDCAAVDTEENNKRGKDFPASQQQQQQSIRNILNSTSHMVIRERLVDGRSYSSIYLTTSRIIGHDG
jgi:hypothetical protein